MSSYTNVTIPELYDNARDMVESIEVKNLKISQLQKRVSELTDILNNIPAAVEEWGFVDLNYDLGRKTIRLVKKSDVPE